MNQPAIVIVDGDEAQGERVMALLRLHGFDVQVVADAAEVHRVLPHPRSRVMVVKAPSNGHRPTSSCPTEPKLCGAPRPTPSFPTPAAACGAPSSAPVGRGSQLIGDSPAMREIKAYIGKVAAADSPVLITGETGTGKELVAELIHRHSRRAAMPFVWINCAAIPDSLLESELFGYERGAFTGAQSRKAGQLELADGGTVFLDEIGDMSPYAQAKILRAIENKAVYRLGGRRSVPLDVRVIAATNQDLERLIAAEKFRKDLYFRLNVARIHLPPLRERRDDIGLLCAYYLREFNQRFRRQVQGLTEEAMVAIVGHDWPGNVRELKNLLEAAFVNAPHRWIALADLPAGFRRPASSAAGALPQDERERLLSALLSTNWNLSRAAQQLHWSRMTVYRKMTKYRIVKGGGRDKGEA